MYTIVLMAALSTGPETLEFNGFFRDLFSFRGGCRGGCTGSCTGNRSEDRTSAQTGSSCRGGCNCDGGIFQGRILSLFGLGRGSCHGNSCYGSCRGNANNCYGSSRGNSCVGNSCLGTRPRDTMLASAGCTGSQALAGCFGTGYGPLDYGFGNSCFGSNLPANSFPGIPSQPMTPGFDFAQPRTVAPSNFGTFGSENCDCYGGAFDTMPRMPGMFAPNANPYSGLESYPGIETYPSMGTLPGSEAYPTISPPSVPTIPGGPPTIMPFDNPAQPRPVAPSVDEERNNSTYRPTKPESNRGTVIVRVPVDAKLYAEGRSLTHQDGQRTFVTPPLLSGREAVYNFKIEYNRGGELITQTKKVYVRPGEQTRVEFSDLLTKKDDANSEFNANQVSLPVGMPSRLTQRESRSGELTIPVPPAAPETVTRRAKITVKLPANAVLYVDGQKNDRTDTVREFVTPELTANKNYSYVMKAELMRNGQPETQTQKIDFRAGDSLEVDFTK